MRRTGSSTSRRCYLMCAPKFALEGRISRKGLVTPLIDGQFFSHFSSSPQLTELFLDASRGVGNMKNNNNALLKFFPLQSHHIGHYHDNGLKKLSCQSPADFHQELCHRMQHAKKRVLLATLYVGTSSSILEKEAQFLDALTTAAINLKKQEGSVVKVLMDASRARRKTPSTSDEKTTTCSAQAVFNCIETNSPSNKGKQQGVYLFKVHPFSRSLTSPFNEIIGVFHIKAYVIDDCLILSGANLSEEYFDNRHDRYLLFTNGGNGLVDFYANLIELFCSFSEKYSSSEDENNEQPQSLFSSASATMSSSTKQRDLLTQLQHLFCSSKEENNNTIRNEDDNINRKKYEGHNNIIAYAVPTIQFPIAYNTSSSGVFGFTRNDSNKTLNFASDMQIIRNLILCAMDQKQHQTSKRRNVSLRLASAYLNPTKSLMKILTTSTSTSSNMPQDHNDNCISTANVFMLTAGKDSHGFAPKESGGTHNNHRDKNKKTSWIPFAYDEINHQINSQLIKMYNPSFVSLFNRKNWTFHSKGLWISVGHQADENDNETRQHEAKNYDKTQQLQQHQQQSKITNPSDLRVVVIGSGNYGSRSERLDLESNCVLVLAPPKARKIDNTATTEATWLQHEARKIDNTGTTEATWLQHEFSEEWNRFLNHAHPIVDDADRKKNNASLSSWLMKRFVLPAVRLFL